ncbi:MAG: hypothetical protein EU548_03315 [Promethearchaeota archaeon]|nr:MAG: hypothetical protein EU548_03315 [Candidatus Lokiarchaeota archaeon]
MKGMCYLVLIVAFLMFYQREPFFSIIIIGAALGLYFLFRARRVGKRGGSRGFLASLLQGTQTQDDKVGDLITLMMVQQLLQDNNKSHSINKPQKSQFSKREEEIDQTKKEILDLFDERLE